MENYLYFRKNRPISASVTLGSATQTCPAFAVADIGALAGNDNENEIAAISILSLDGGGTGHASVLFTMDAIVPTVDYSTTALAIATGTTHWINPADQAYENGVLVLDGHGTSGGSTGMIEAQKNATDDTITLTHAALGFEKVCKVINDACNAYPKDGRLIKVYDGHDGQITSLNSNPAAITLIEYASEGGAAGMAT
mgnify:CR=1 FL=1